MWVKEPTHSPIVWMAFSNFKYARGAFKWTAVSREKNRDSIHSPPIVSAASKKQLCETHTVRKCLILHIQCKWTKNGRAAAMRKQSSLCPFTFTFTNAEFQWNRNMWLPNGCWGIWQIIWYYYFLSSNTMEPHARLCACVLCVLHEYVVMRMRSSRFMNWQHCGVLYCVLASSLWMLDLPNVWCHTKYIVWCYMLLPSPNRPAFAMRAPYPWCMVRVSLMPSCI